MLKKFRILNFSNRCDNQIDDYEKVYTMSGVLTLLSDLKISRNTQFLFVENDTFPSCPPIGCLTFVDGILYIYSIFSSIETWYPLTTLKRTYIHIQGIENNVWAVTHNLNNANFVICVYDDLDQIQYPVISSITNNSFNLGFVEPTKGRAIVFVDNISEETNIANIFEAIKLIDGSNSGLDADLLDGNHGSYYLNATNINTGTLNSSLFPDSTIIPNTYTKLTINSKGIATAGSNLNSSDIISALGYAPTGSIPGITLEDDLIRIGSLDRTVSGIPKLDFVSTPGTLTYDVRLEVIDNTLDIKAEHLTINGDDIWFCNDGDISSNSFVTTNTDQFAADSYDINFYHAVEIFLLIKYGAQIHSTKILLSNDGITTYITEYGTIMSSSSLGFIDSDITNGQVRLLITPIYNNCIVKLIRIGIKT